MPNQINGNRWVIALALWVPVGFTLVLFYLATMGQRARDLDAKWVLHTVEVKDQVQNLDSLVNDVEASERGFLLTGDESFLPLYDGARSEIPAESGKLARLIHDNPTQVTNAAHFQVLIAEKLAKAAHELSQVRKEKVPETLETYRNTQGKALNDEIRRQVAAMNAEEDRLLAQREDEFALEVKWQKKEMMGLVAVEIALIISLTLLLLRSRKMQLTADKRIGEARALTDQAQATTFKAMARTEQAEVRATQADTRTEEAEIRSEEGIRASELRYRRLFETAQDGIIVLEAATGRIVDANPFMQTLLGYRVLTATDGAEAVAVFAENKNEIAVVLTDMSMPIMDGASLIRALTKINPGIKIIAASGLNVNGNVAKVAGVTVKHFLTKPYTARTLLKVIRATLDHTSAE
jgi:CHASE3 domain sensor protein/CheY-like chemotaxis protein